MTHRERQLLRWIEENPMISQQELADKAGITRSSAAVHISNLMKKGYIAGKGYIVRSAPYAVVIGGEADMEVMERIAENLEIVVTDEVVKSADFDMNHAFLDAGVG